MQIDYELVKSVLLSQLQEALIFGLTIMGMVLAILVALKFFKRIINEPSGADIGYLYDDYDKTLK